MRSRIFFVLLASKVSTNEVIEHTLSGKPWEIKGWMVYGCNLISTSANQRQTFEALQKLKFMFAIDVLPTEITSYADVILPECTYLERYDDLHNPSYRSPYVAIRQPVVAPMYDSKPAYEIAQMMAAKMGQADLFATDIETYLDARLQKIGSSLQEIKIKGVLRKPDSHLYRRPEERLKFKTTACSSICPTSALTLVDLNSSDGVAKRLMNGREIVQDKTHLGTKPKLFWLL